MLALSHSNTPNGAVCASVAPGTNTRILGPAAALVVIDAMRRGDNALRPDQRAGASIIVALLRLAERSSRRCRPGSWWCRDLAAVVGAGDDAAGAGIGIVPLHRFAQHVTQRLRRRRFAVRAIARMGQRRHALDGGGRIEAERAAAEARRIDLRHRQRLGAGRNARRRGAVHGGTRALVPGNGVGGEDRVATNATPSNSAEIVEMDLACMLDCFLCLTVDR